MYIFLFLNERTISDKNKLNIRKNISPFKTWISWSLNDQNWNMNEQLTIVTNVRMRGEN